MTRYVGDMNIPVEIARAQGGHGVKGGRPRLNLSQAERTERRRLQHETCRRRRGIPARSGSCRVDPYFEIWGKPYGQPLTPEEFAIGESKWNARVVVEQTAVKARERVRMDLRHQRNKRRRRVVRRL